MVKPTIKPEKSDNNEQNISFKKLISFYRFILNRPIKSEKEVANRKIKFKGEIPFTIKHKMELGNNLKNFYWVNGELIEERDNIKQEKEIKKQKPLYEITKKTKTEKGELKISELKTYFSKIKQNLKERTKEDKREIYDPKGEKMHKTRRKRLQEINKRILAERRARRQKEKERRLQLLKEFAETNTFFGSHEVKTRSDIRKNTITKEVNNRDISETMKEEIKTFFNNNSLVIPHQYNSNKQKKVLRKWVNAYLSRRNNPEALKTFFKPYNNGEVIVSYLAEEIPVTKTKQQKPKKESLFFRNLI